MTEGQATGGLTGHIVACGLDELRRQGEEVPGTTIPAGNVATGLTMLIGVGYVVLRRR